VKKPLLILFVLTALVSVDLFAANTSSSNVKLTVAGPSLEAKVDVGYVLEIPMLQKDGMLFKENNLKLKGTASLSPIAATAKLEAVLTPIAVMELNLGGSIGTGWDFGLLDLSGLRLGSGDIGSDLASDQFGGVYYEAKAGAAFQFDTAAVFPGEWKSVVLRAYQELNYQAYTGADDDTAWNYENSGAMVNGFNYEASYFVGYQMPLKLNMVGLLLDTYVYDLFDDDSSALFYDLGLVANYAFDDALSLSVIPQFTNIEKASDTYELTTQSFGFKRIVLMVNYKF
jgi:hypothetical protein